MYTSADVQFRRLYHGPHVRTAIDERCSVAVCKGFSNP
jgi:hypothetical protein